MYNLFFKKIIDFTVAFALLMLMLPFLIMVAFFIKIDSKGPVFFRQKRVGKNLKTFNLFKFRTMTNEKREVGNTPIIGRASGVTKVGYFLRRFKIDELPQLINVLNLQMSLVGPRPNVESKLAGMTEEQLKRYSVTPGLTGLAQVSGNIHLPWEKRFELDLHYIKHRSFLVDMKIIFRTLFIVLRGEKKYKGKTLNI